jgi:hypothetical protein
MHLRSAHEKALISSLGYFSLEMHDIASSIKTLLEKEEKFASKFNSFRVCLMKEMTFLKQVILTGDSKGPTQN